MRGVKNKKFPIVFKTFKNKRKYKVGKWTVGFKWDTVGQTLMIVKKIVALYFKYFSTAI